VELSPGEGGPSSFCWNLCILSSIWATGAHIPHAAAPFAISATTRRQGLPVPGPRFLQDVLLRTTTTTTWSSPPAGPDGVHPSSSPGSPGNVPATSPAAADGLHSATSRPTILREPAASSESGRVRGWKRERTGEGLGQGPERRGHDPLPHLR